MNSFVSVEDEEVICCDGLDNLVLSANISGSSIESESDYESSNTNENSNDSFETANRSSTVQEDLLVCLGNSDSIEPINVSLDSNGYSIEKAFCSKESAADFPGFSVDLNCLPILLNNDVISFDDDFLASEIGLDKLFLSDTDSNDSFDGFTESSSSSFEGFVQKHNKVLLNKENILSGNSVTRLTVSKNKDQAYNLAIQKKKRNPYKVPKLLRFSRLKASQLRKRQILEKQTRGRPRKYLSTTLPQQNNSKGFDNTFHHSSSKNPPKEINDTNQFGKHKWQGEEEILLKGTFSDKEVNGLNASPTKPNLKSDSAHEEVFNPASPRATLCSNFDGTEIALSPSSSTYLNLYRSSSEESFEGFHENDFNDSNYLLESDRTRSYHQKVWPKSPVYTSSNTRPDNNVNNKHLTQDSEFIGFHCNLINCTISWLESAECNNIPVPVNNGVVFELHEFAKKINWESHYVAIWILRLMGYEKVNISDDDLKKINLIVRRRKAITINFAGSHSYKSKLSAFDKELFSLPTAEKLEKEKFTNNKEEISVVNYGNGISSENNNSNSVTKKEKENLTSYDNVNKKLVFNKNIEKTSKPGTNSFSNENKSSKKNLKTQIDGELLVPYSNSISNERNKELNIEQLELEQLKPKPIPTSCPHLSGRPRGRPRKYPLTVPEQNSSKSFDKTFNLSYLNGKNTTEETNALPDSYRASNNISKESNKEFNIGIRKRTRHQSDPILRQPSNLGLYDGTLNKTCQITEISSEKPKLLNLPEKEQELRSSVMPTLSVDNIAIGNKDGMLKLATKVKNILHENKIIEMPGPTNDKILVSPSKPKRTSIEETIIENTQDGPILNSSTLSSPKESSSFCSVDSFAISSKGRIRKPTIKIQDLFSAKQCKLTNVSIESSFSNTNISSTSKIGSPKSMNKESFPVKPIPNIFKDDNCVIGNHCQEASINVKLLNSNDEAKKPITNGVIYELYHFFKKRNAKLTSLVHTIYRLKGLTIEKAPIISTMAKIHELVKVVWEEQVKADPSMPYKEFEMGIPSKNFVSHQLQPNINDNESKNTENSTKKRKIDKSLNRELADRSSYLASKNDTGLSSFDSNMISKIDNRIFDLNVTKGQEGEITKGDIVYVYTKWLKKKMEGQCKVFVTDLSKDVEDLIIARKVGTIRIPVGTLMSSSVKIFEEFRRLSKINMQEAKNFLLEDWIQVIKALLNPMHSKKSFNPEDTNANLNLSSTNTDSEHEDQPSTIEEHQEVSQKISNDSEDTELILAPVKIGLSTKVKPRKEQQPTCDEKNKMEIINKKKININNDIPKNKYATSKIAEDYEVEKIVGYRIVKIGLESITEYRVRWVGFSPEEDSWVNVADLQCPDRLSEFWDALKKQRAMKKQGNTPSEQTAEKLPHLAPTENCPLSSGQENVPPFNEREPVTSQTFLNLLIKNLKPILIDYQYDEEGSIPKRVRVSKGDILNIFDKWRQENKEKLLTGANRPLAVNILISRVKIFMDSKKVRNFNPNCLIDTCFRMSLMKEKLNDPCKVKEYLRGDFMELFESSRKHQESVRLENVKKLKMHKNEKLLIEFNPHNEIDDKQKHINKIEKESFLIAKYLNKYGLKANLTDTLKEDIASLKKVFGFGTAVESSSGSTIEALKLKNKVIVQELKECGLKENKLDELIKMALNST